MIYRIFSGTRCRATRRVHHPAGSIDRHAHGTIRYGMENLGRELVLVDWDTGKATVVFPEEIELLTIEETGAESATTEGAVIATEPRFAGALA